MDWIGGQKNPALVRLLQNINEHPTPKCSPIILILESKIHYSWKGFSAPTTIDNSISDRIVLSMHGWRTQNHPLKTFFRRTIPTFFWFPQPAKSKAASSSELLRNFISEYTSGKVTWVINVQFFWPVVRTTTFSLEGSEEADSLHNWWLFKPTIIHN